MKGLKDINGTEGDTKRGKLIAMEVTEWVIGGGWGVRGSVRRQKWDSYLSGVFYVF